MDVSLIVMPFASVHRPSIGVSLLKAGLSNMGVLSKVHYFNLKFAELIGLELNDRIAEMEFSNASLIGELVFSNFVFNEINSQSSVSLKKALSQILSNYSDSKLENVLKDISYIQDRIPEFIDECSSIVLQERPKLIGFTSTFHQNCASLALAKVIKDKSNLPVIFGGANVEGEMGAALLKKIPWVDFVCSGEGDIAFIEFMKTIDNHEHSKINGIITPESSSLEVSLTNPVMNMDNLPFPDYHDYFEVVQESPIKEKIAANLVIETSRGCWWGEVSQCTFCGLNGSTMKYRSKSVSRAIDELEYLIKKYNIIRVSVVDNILDLEYITKLFPQISSKGIKVELFYETKSNISKKQLMIMKQGGLYGIQPGIESLSDIILRIMKKGVTALQNIQLLKWCGEMEIIPYWNIIWGFPYEPEEEYEKMARLIPLLVHLYPPGGFGKIVMDRFSPYFLEPEKNGMINQRPSQAYQFVYPFPEQELFRFAYHFDFDYSDGRDPTLYVQNLDKEIKKWQKLWQMKESPSLYLMNLKSIKMINDTRPCALQKIHIIANEKARIYEICDNVHSFNAIFLKLQDEFPLVTESDVRSILAELVNAKLMLFDGVGYLSLAIHYNQYPISPNNVGN